MQPIHLSRSIACVALTFQLSLHAFAQNEIRIESTGPDDTRRIEVIATDPFAVSGHNTFVVKDGMLTPDQLEKILDKLPSEAREAFEQARKQLAESDPQKDKSPDRARTGVIVVRPDGETLHRFYYRTGEQAEAPHEMDEAIRDKVIRELPDDVRKKLELVEDRIAVIREGDNKNTKLRTEIAKTGRIVIVDPNGKKQEYSFHNKEEGDQPRRFNSVDDVLKWHIAKSKRESESDPSVAKKLDLILKRLESLENRVNELSGGEDAVSREVPHPEAVAPFDVK